MSWREREIRTAAFGSVRGGGQFRDIVLAEFERIAAALADGGVEANAEFEIGWEHLKRPEDDADRVRVAARPFARWLDYQHAAFLFPLDGLGEPEHLHLADLHPVEHLEDDGARSGFSSFAGVGNWVSKEA